MANVVIVTGATDLTAGASYDGASVPIDADNVYFRNSTTNFAAASQPTLEYALLEIEMSFTGNLPTTGEWVIGPLILNVGRNPGTSSPAGSRRINISSGIDPCVLNVYNTASTSLDSGFGPFRWKGTDAGNVLNQYGGIVGIATNHPADVATLATINQFGGTLDLGGGCTLTTINMNGSAATATIRSAFTTLNQNDGSVIVYGSGAATTISFRAGSHTNYSTGTITTLTVFPGLTFNKWSGAATITATNLHGTIDLSKATGTITFTNVTAYSNDATIFDPLGKAVFSNAITFAAGIRQCLYIGKGGSTLLPVA